MGIPAPNITFEMRDGRDSVRTSGRDGNNWVDDGTGNSREGGGQWDGS